MAAIEIIQDGPEVEVWLDEFICIGTGPNRDVAIARAREELTARLADLDGMSREIDTASALTDALGRLQGRRSGEA